MNLVFLTMAMIPDQDCGAVSVQRVGFESIPAISVMNQALFHESRIINTFERKDLIILLASEGGDPVGFKIGYGQDSKVYYSAKGGVMPQFRRRGIATKLLDKLMSEAAGLGYEVFSFDTFPDIHPGMTALALRGSFTVQEVRYNDVYRNFRVRFYKSLVSDQILVEENSKDVATGIR